MPPGNEAAARGRIPAAAVISLADDLNTYDTTQVIIAQARRKLVDAYAELPLDRDHAKQRFPLLLDVTEARS
jgi:hypothetical protein